MDGMALAAIAIGSIFLYSGIKGKGVLNSIQAVVQGKAPSTTGPVNQIVSPIPSVVTANNTPNPIPPGVSGGTNQQILQKTAAEFGWTGSEWNALAQIENLEDSGYSTTIRNPSSGALGIAQALGHGNANTAGSYGNEYGGYGLTDAEAKAANNGDASMQSLWMCNYISQTYGTPSNALAFHEANGYY